MTQDAIRRALNYLRYDGGWSVRGIAKLCGLSAPTITLAMTGSHVSEATQARLSQFIPRIPRNAPKKKEPKRKPGHLKRYLIRYYNLRGWLKEIEKEPGITKQFKNYPKKNMSRQLAAYTCARLDYQMKHHLLDLFGDVLKQHHVVMCDAYPAEQWITRIQKLFPRLRPMLFKKIGNRKVTNERQPKQK